MAGGHVNRERQAEHMAAPHRFCDVKIFLANTLPNSELPLIGHYGRFPPRSGSRWGPLSFSPFSPCPSRPSTLQTSPRDASPLTLANEADLHLGGRCLEQKDAPSPGLVTL